MDDKEKFEQLADRLHGPDQSLDPEQRERHARMLGQAAGWVWHDDPEAVTQQRAGNPATETILGFVFFLLLLLTTFGWLGFVIYQMHENGPAALSILINRISLALYVAWAVVIAAFKSSRLSKR